MKTDLELVEIIDKELEDLRLTQLNLESELASVKDHIRKYNRIKTVLNEESKNGSKAAKTKKPQKISARVMDLTQAYLSVMPHEREFTANDVSAGIGVGLSTVHKALVELRNVGEIHLVRKGGRTGVTRFYKVALKVK